MSFHGTRTTAWLGYGAAAWSCVSRFSRSAGECSVSSRIQSKPAPAITSTV
jgi:hypothetical protein